MLWKVTTQTKTLIKIHSTIRNLRPLHLPTLPLLANPSGENLLSTVISKWIQIKYQPSKLVQYFLLKVGTVVSVAIEHMWRFYPIPKVSPHLRLLEPQYFIGSCFLATHWFLEILVAPSAPNGSTVHITFQNISLNDSRLSILSFLSRNFGNETSDLRWEIGLYARFILPRPLLTFPKSNEKLAVRYPTCGYSLKIPPWFPTSSPALITRMPNVWHHNGLVENDVEHWSNHRILYACINDQCYEHLHV